VREGLLSDVLVRGLLAEGLGMNAGDRMRLSQLLIPEDRFRREMSFPELAFRYAGGPAGSVAEKIARAGKDLSKGNYLRGVEQALPTGFANVIKALGRYETEGVRTRDGLIIRDDLTGGELAGQLFGFSPMKVVRTQEDIGERKYIERTISNKRQELLNKYKLGYFVGDKEALVNARRDIIKFNTRHRKKFPGYQILEGTLDRSISSADKIRRTGVADGVRISPAMQPFMNDLDALNSQSKGLAKEVENELPLGN